MTADEAAATWAPYPSGAIRMTPRGAELPTWMRTARSSPAKPPMRSGRSRSTSLTAASRRRASLPGRPSGSRMRRPGPRRSVVSSTRAVSMPSGSRGINGHDDHAVLKPAFEGGLRCARSSPLRQQERSRVLKRHGRPPRRTGAPRSSRRRHAGNRHHATGRTRTATTPSVRGPWVERSTAGSLRKRTRPRPVRAAGRSRERNALARCECSSAGIQRPWSSANVKILSSARSLTWNMSRCRAIPASPASAITVTAGFRRRGPRAGRGRTRRSRGSARRTPWSRR